MMDVIKKMNVEDLREEIKYAMDESEKIIDEDKNKTK